MWILWKRLRGASRSTARTGSLPRKTLVVFQAALSLVLLSASGLLTAALHSLENQNFGFEQDRRIVANIESTAGRLPGELNSPALPAHPRFRSSHPRRSVRSALCSYSPLSGGRLGWRRLGGWTSRSRTIARTIPPAGIE